MVQKNKYKKLEELKTLNEAPDWLEEKGYQMLINGYLLDSETPRGMWTRVSNSVAKYLKRPDLAERFFDIMWKGWLCPATPVLSNTGTDRGFNISCFSIHVPDTTVGILNKGTELGMLTKYGGGVGIYMGDVRPAGSPISKGGYSEGILPFAKIYMSVATGISQGGVRRGAAAVYLPIEHGDLKSFLRMRRPEGDPERQCLHLHHGVTITDEFMHKIEDGDPKAQETMREILKTRLETGEPYMFFSDTVNRDNPPAYQKHGLSVKTSNICSEITLHTDDDHTFVCCLSSMNLSKWHEWKDTDAVYLSIYFLDGVLSEFIDKAKNVPGFESAINFAEKSRALGLGVLGFHSLLQSEMASMDSFYARNLNRAIFKRMKEEALRASQDLAKEFGEPLWCEGTGVRNTHLLAVAPTSSNSIISGNNSAGIEPISANVYSKKTAKGNFIDYNPELMKLLAAKGFDKPEVWKLIIEDEGSVRRLDFLTEEEKNVFKTAYEIDQNVIIDLAADRQKYICQSQSLNLFFSSAELDPNYFFEVHWNAWKKGIKTLYYVRSDSVLKADISSRGDCKACEA